MNRLMQVIISICMILSWELCHSKDFNELIVGAWELERYDNIKPVNQPPAGLINITYLFFDEGKSKHFVPGKEDKITYGRNNTPYKEYIPFKIEGNKFTGWLGLTNDLHTPKTINFLSNDEFEIIFSDESIALFKRTSNKPNNYPKNDIISVPYTMRGVNYNKKFIQETREALKLTNSKSKFDSKIIGRWLLIDKVENIKMILEFAENQEFIRTIELIESSLDFPPEIVKGTYKLYGDILTASTFRGAPARIDIQDDKLTYTMDGIQHITLTKLK